MVVHFDLRVDPQMWARSSSLEPVAKVELDKGGVSAECSVAEASC